MTNGIRSHSKSSQVRLRPADIAAAIVSLFFFLGLGQTTSAATITVDTTADELDVDGNCSLREAIQAANTDEAVDGCAAGSGGDTITLPAGRYALSIVGDGEDANDTGDLDITDDLSIVGAGADTTIIDAARIDRILHVDPTGSGVTVAISGVTFQNGLATAAGALAAFGGGIMNRGTLTLDRCVVRHNTGAPLDVFGGGIWNGGMLTLNDSTVSENGSLDRGVFGGGIDNDSGGTAIIKRSTINGNMTGREGGGIANRGSSLTIENSTISGNTAFGPGGIQTGAGTITNSTVTGNVGVFGGGICCGPFTNVKNTIIAGNTSLGFGGDCLGGVNSAGHNLDGDGSCGLAAPGDISGADPHLGPLADNGGPTQTHALLADSPAIDAGSGDCLAPFTDQRGVARPQGAACDIGAFELAPPNRPPHAEAGPQQVVECAVLGGAVVVLDGSGSTDPDSAPGTNDDIRLFEWFEDFGMPTQRLLGLGEPLDVALSLGIHHVTLRVTDRTGETNADDTLITVADTTAPIVTIHADPDYLWPPNHRMDAVHNNVTVVEACDPSPRLVLEPIVSSEPDDAAGTGDGNTTGDIQDASIGTADFDVLLRAERDGSGAGRTYATRYQATDASGNVGVGAETVTVPHDQNAIEEPVSLRIDEAASTLVSWQPVYQAQHFDNIRGSLDQFRVAGSNLDLGAVICLATNSTDDSTVGREDAAVPEPSKAFFYLVQFYDGIMESSYGEPSASKARVLGAGSQGCH